MASGTLTQAAAPPSSHGVAPSPRQMSAAVATSTASVVAQPKCAATRTPSVSASPKRGAQQGQFGHLPLQWPGATRPASAVAPTAANPSSSGFPRGAPGVSRQSSAERVPSAAAAVAVHSAALASAATETLPAYLSAATLGDAARRPTASAIGSSSVAGSATGPVGGGSGNVPPPARSANVAAVVPKLPASGLASSFNSKGAPPPQTPLPVGGKGYSSIQLWTPRTQRQLGTEAKQAAAPREARELSVEPVQVGRSPSASLSLSPRCYPSMGLHSASAMTSVSTSGALLSKLSSWRS